MSLPTPLRRSLALLGILILGQACQVVREFKYSPPPAKAQLVNERIVPASFDSTWKALISNVGKRFFAIDAFEKESGLITLSFSASPFSEAVTGGYCTLHYDNSSAAAGQFWATGVSAKKIKIDFAGDYADYVEKFLNGTMQGRMNLVVAEVAPNKTRVTVNARFVVSAVATNPTTGVVERNTWSWNSGEECRQFVTTAEGEREQRIMQSTNQVELQILDTIDGLFNSQPQ